MSLKIIEINAAINSDGKVVFKFPKGTLLDHIPHDLWNIIIKHHQKYQPFIIGKFCNHYFGYRLVTCNDFTKDFIEEFIRYYRKNDGLYSVEQVNVNQDLSINQHPILIGMYDEFLVYSQITNKCLFGTSYYINSIDISKANLDHYYMSIRSYRKIDNVNALNLFISDEYRMKKNGK